MIRLSRFNDHPPSLTDSIVQEKEIPGANLIHIMWRTTHIVRTTVSILQHCKEGGRD